MTEDSKLLLEIQNLVAEALQVPVEMVTPELTMGDVPQWDSFGHMEVMLRLEEKFGLTVDADTISRLTSVGEIHRYLRGDTHEP